MDFINGKQLIELCKERDMTISEVMATREKTAVKISQEELDERLLRVFEIMCEAVQERLDEPRPSMGGLIGGEGQKLRNYYLAGGGFCGSLQGRAVAYSMAVLEQNASMGLIVAAPTAGSAGVLPGVLIAAYHERDYSIEDIIQGILNAGAIGYLLTRNASVSGAQAGCQAEIGSAAAMAASALVELEGGTPEQSLTAASLAISNLLGLACDPIAGLVECPCQSRNAIGVANALVCADMALAGVTHPVPFDEMAECLLRVGKSLPYQIRETALGGCAATPTGMALKKEITGGTGLEALNRV